MGTLQVSVAGRPNAARMRSGLGARITVDTYGIDLAKPAQRLVLEPELRVAEGH